MRYFDKWYAAISIFLCEVALTLVSYGYPFQPKLKISQNHYLSSLFSFGVLMPVKKKRCSAIVKSVYSYINHSIFNKQNAQRTIYAQLVSMVQSIQLTPFRLRNGQSVVVSLERILYAYLPLGPEKSIRSVGPA